MKLRDIPFLFASSAVVGLAAVAMEVAQSNAAMKPLITSVGCSHLRNLVLIGKLSPPSTALFFTNAYVDEVAQTIGNLHGITEEEAKAECRGTRRCPRSRK